MITNTPLAKLFISSSIYSFTPLFEKIILKTLTKDIYIFIKYTLRFVSVLGFNILNNNHGSLYSKIVFNTPKILSVLHLLVAAALVAFSSQYFYFDALKSMDISVVEPVGNVLINLFTIAIGVFFLNEKLTRKKMAGIILGVLSIYFLGGEG